MRTPPQIIICLCVIAIIIIGFGGMKKKIAMTMIQLKVTRMLGLIEHLIHPIPIEVSISTMASKKKRKFSLRSQSQTGHRNDKIKAKRLSLSRQDRNWNYLFLEWFHTFVNGPYVYVRVAETLLMETFPELSPQAKKKGRIESFLDPAWFSWLLSYPLVYQRYFFSELQATLQKECEFQRYFFSFHDSKECEERYRKSTTLGHERDNFILLVRAFRNFKECNLYFDEKSLLYVIQPFLVGLK